MPTTIEKASDTEIKKTVTVEQIIPLIELKQERDGYLARKTEYEQKIVDLQSAADQKIAACNLAITDIDNKLTVLNDQIAQAQALGVN